MTEMIKLTNGKEVPLEEFITWSVHKQQANVRSYNSEKLSIQGKKGGKNRKITPQLCKNLSNAIQASWNKGERNFTPRTGKSVMTPYGKFESIKELSEVSNKSQAVVYSWLKKYPESYYYLPKE